MATTNDKKLLTQEIFEQSLKDVLQVIADNCYNWQEYTDTEISDILEISDEQAMELSKIINDNLKATNKLWSSNKVDEAIQNAVIEANEYADQLIGNISSISLEYVTSLPDVGASNVIYILSGTPNTLNVYNTSTSAFVTVGDLDIDFTQFYNKDQVDALLADKANTDEVVSNSDVVNDMTTVSNGTVLSTVGLKTELDKKLDTTGDTKDNITTFTSSDDAENISSVWTDFNALVSGAKQSELFANLSIIAKNARYLNKLIGNDDISDIGTSLTNAITYLFDYFDIYRSIYQFDGYSTFQSVPINHSNYTFSVNIKDTADATSPYPTGTNMFWNCVQLGGNGKMTQIATQVLDGTGKDEVWIRNRNGDAWGSWIKMPTNKVADCYWTYATVADKLSSGSVRYRVKNGICFVQCNSLKSATMSTNDEVIATGLPKCEINYYWNTITANVVTDIPGLLVYVNTNGELINYIGSDNVDYYGAFSYPVAEN